MNKLSSQALQFPHFLYLLPLFFVFHGYAQNPAPVTFQDFIQLLFEYFLAGCVLFLAGWIFYRKWQKAALLSFGLLFLHLFFGAFHDVLKKISPSFFLAKYSVLLPVILFLVLYFLFYLKRTNSHFSRLFTYLNLLFLLLLLIDLPLLLQHKNESPAGVALQPCTECDKPDVYLIIADEYADSTSLSDVFHFNNGSFQGELRNRGFYIVKSISNYNFTPFAMASLFTMDYLPGLEGRNSSYADRLKCAELINRNTLWDFFVNSGYDIRNNAIYRINNQATAAPQSYFRIGTEFISSHTLLSRLKKDLGYHLVTTLKIQSVIDEYIFYVDKSNKRLLNRYSADVRRGNSKSQFVYTHIHMPHYPYYYTGDGSPNPDAAKEDNPFDKKAYIGYLQYSNGIYLQLIDDILKHASRPPIILLMGDHGFREFVNPTPEQKKIHFMNLNAVYLPNGDYKRFYDGISGVNQFRALLNTSFGQNLPMLKDSTQFLEE